MELPKNKSGAGHVPGARVQAEMANRRHTQEAGLRSTIERVGSTLREGSAQLRGTVGEAGDTMQFSKLAAHVAEQEQMQNDRRSQIEQLRRSYESGALNDPERLGRAAEKLMDRYQG